jgi:hypothetical protein
MPSFLIGKNELASFKTIEKGTNYFALAPLRGYMNPPALGTSAYLNDVSKIHVLALDPKVLTRPSPFYEHFLVSSGGAEGTNFDDAIKIYKRFFGERVDADLFPLTGKQPRKALRLDSRRTEMAFGIKLKGYETQVKSLLEHYVELAGAA